jgi:HlyD family secretion protein
VRAEKVTRSKVSSLQSKMISLQTNGSQVALDEASLEQAQAGLELAQAKLAYTTLKAPVDGVLIARNVEPGDVVQPGETLMQLSPSGETQMVVQIEEKNLHLLALNQSALASADAYPDQLFSAQLVYINPGIDSDRGSVEVKLQVPEPPDYLRQDMTVSVDIKVASRSDAVLVSSAAVHDVNSVAPWVLKLDGKQVHRQVVTLGLRSDGMSEVLTGLSAGDQVVPVSSVTVTDGDRIRPLLQADSL